MLRLGRGACALLGVVLFAAPHSTAGAEPGPSEGTPPREVGAPLDAAIEIERAPGAEACPDAEAVFRAIRRLFPELSLRQNTSAGESAAHARVVIRALSPGYEAVMTVLRPRPGERVLVEKDEDCRGLADALALAFVMLVEPPKTTSPAADVTVPDASASPVASGAAVTPPPAASVRDDVSSAPPPPRAADKDAGAGHPGHAFHLDIGAAAVGGVGVLSEPALGGAGKLELFHRSGWGGALEGMRLWSSPADGQGGSVSLRLWAVLFGPYYRARLSKQASLQAGLLVGVGSQSAKVKDFTQPQSGPFPWSVLMPALGYRRNLGSVASAFASLGPVIQLRPQSFSVLVDSGGKTQQIAAAPRIGVMAELGIAFGGDIF